MASGLAPSCSISTFICSAAFLSGSRASLTLPRLNKHPAQAVEVRAAFGVFLQGLADHRFGFFEVLALLGVEVAQVVVGPGIVGVTREQQLELGLSLARSRPGSRR